MIHKKNIEQCLWLVPFLASAAGYFFISYKFQSKTIKTPHFIGLSLHQAMLSSANQNIRLQIISEKEYAHVEPGTIIDQRPCPGFSIKEKQSVHIITARAPEEKKAPDILNKTIKNIAVICEKARIKNKQYLIPSNNATDICIAQIPQVGEAIKDNKIITYIAQPHTPFFVLPNFSGIALGDVITFLKEQAVSFSVYEKSIKLQPPYPTQKIILNQKPLVGSFIKLDLSTHIQLQI
jgi:beta-lactam-binding protein with PASTA domain